ncbi:hypothetical protein CYMTET_47064 [Cymbomonas tetramitiformis]|uniref:DUS-like FMN-binding domain-containing protein n=1 Tax=Cymbomonas tetramitiformis TaxID=36881 RepID=A0AAE0BUY2_9CHLO|nr:hypothetical protein CYMTET_47064 [Cymbomonas tetramitiformis]
MFAMHENLATTREVNDAKGAASCTLSIAPMMECTDKHYRCLARLLTRHTQLYTEMVVDQSIIYNQAQVIGPAQSYEHPITVQLGGSDPEMLAKAAVVCERLGYDEINLNVGCPSPKVVNKKKPSACFGARLMTDPPHVAKIVARLQEVVSIPVTVKCRTWEKLRSMPAADPPTSCALQIGVDDLDQYEHLKNFVETVVEALGPTAHFIVHARKVHPIVRSVPQRLCVVHASTVICSSRFLAFY